jgi:hypothetical protein
MSRQIGTALGVSLLIAVLGTPVGYLAAHQAFQHGWWALAVTALAAAITAPGMTPRTQAAAPVLPVAALAADAR